MTDKPENSKEVKLELQVDEAVAPGKYVNFSVSNFSESEFMVDFIFVAPGVTRASVLSRLVMSPTHAKRLATLLAAQVAAYEQRFGTIVDHATAAKSRDANGNFIN